MGLFDRFRRKTGGPGGMRARLEGAMARRRLRGWNPPLENVNALVASGGPRLLARAREILEGLESGNTAEVGLPEQTYLFGPAAMGEPSKVEKELEGIDPDALSPREAHDMLYRLKHLMNRPRE